MRVVRARDFETFRDAARVLLDEGAPPASVVWEDAQSLQASLFAPVAQAVVARAPARRFRVPRRFVALAERAALYRADDRFALLYRALYRLQTADRDLLDDELDPDVRELVQRAESVRQDEHRMHAFVRFRRSELDGEAHFVAWYRPAHRVLRLAAPFFARRFRGQRWTILTPDESASWDGAELRYGAAAQRADAPADDELEALFRTYYRATYNPARANLRLFQKHVPRAFRGALPELTVLSELASEMATKRSTAAEAAHNPRESAAPLVPESRALTQLRAAAATCLACPLGAAATQTVFGEGARQARLVLVGEQPGDEEDQRGKPFVGPAGKLLDRALEEAGIVRREVYVTNAVKHFSYRPVGKKRLHQKPAWQHVEACRPWLRAELEAIRPELIVCLGATAAQSFLGRRFTILKNRGRVFDTPWAKAFIVTYHPSAILRAPSKEARAATYEALLSDLALARQVLAGEGPAHIASSGA